MLPVSFYVPTTEIKLTEDAANENSEKTKVPLKDRLFELIDEREAAEILDVDLERFQKWQQNELIPDFLSTKEGIRYIFGDILADKYWGEESDFSNVFVDTLASHALCMDDIIDWAEEKKELRDAVNIYVLYREQIHQALLIKPDDTP